MLLCYPGVHEYNSAHWAFRRLAGMLARAGHHVLRFDYFGTGDSGGTSEDFLPSRCAEDTRRAAAELMDLSGARKLSLVGLRLGASFALEACRGGLNVQNAILWEPVVSGSAYLSELESRDALRNILLLHWVVARKRRSELLGFPMTDEQRRALDALDTTEGALPSVDKICLIGSEERGDYRRLMNALGERGAQVEFELVHDPAVAEGAQRGAKALLSNEALGAIVSRLSGGARA